MNLPRPAWLALALLAACASSPPTWEKPGATETAVKDDSEQCRMQASLAPMPQHYAPAPSGSATVTTGILSRQELQSVHEAEQFQKCMAGKGYSAKR